MALRHLWLAEGSAKAASVHAVLPDVLELEADGRVRVRSRNAIGMVTWAATT